MKNYFRKIISKISKTESQETENYLIVEKDDFKQESIYRDKRGNFHVDFDNILDPQIMLDLKFSIPNNSSSAEALKLTIGYRDNDWLFIGKVTFLIDGQQFEVLGKFERDHSYGTIYEWIDKNVEGDILTLLDKIIHSNSTKVRFTGDQYYKDATIYPEQKEALRNIYNHYKMNGGN